MEESSAKIPRSKIYTRTGDAGMTSLYNGERRAKDDEAVETLGACDELSAFIGLAREHCKQAQNGLDKYLEEIQSRLLDIGSAVATPPATSPEQLVERTRFPDTHTPALERWIDLLDSQLPPLKNFILPSGGFASAALHICRTVCRRAERCATTLGRGDQTYPSVVAYLNRLSDFFFVAARYAAMKEGQAETIYVSHARITSQEKQEKKASSLQFCWSDGGICLPVC